MRRDDFEEMLVGPDPALLVGWFLFGDHDELIKPIEQTVPLSHADTLQLELVIWTHQDISIKSVLYRNSFSLRKMCLSTTKSLHFALDASSSKVV